MAETFPPWRVLGRRRIYTNDWISVDFWSVRLPDGTVIDDYTVLDYPRPAVAVLPIGADSRVLMIDHYRFITDTRGWELPALLRGNEIKDGLTITGLSWAIALDVLADHE